MLWIATLTAALSLIGGTQAFIPGSAAALNNLGETQCVGPEDDPVGEVICVNDDTTGSSGGSSNPGPPPSGPGYDNSTGSDPDGSRQTAARNAALVRPKKELDAKRRMREGEERVRKKLKQLPGGCRQPYEWIQGYFWVEHMRETGQWGRFEYWFSKDFLGQKRVFKGHVELAQRIWVEKQCPGPVPGDETT
jgi:hypothetical protein